MQLQKMLHKRVTNETLRNSEANIWHLRNGNYPTADGGSKVERTYKRTQRSEAAMQRVWLYGWNA